MSEIKRYTPVVGGMCPFDTGPYVLYTDHVNAIKEREQIIMSQSAALQSLTDSLYRFETAVKKLKEVLEQCVPDYKPWMDSWDDDDNLMYRPITFGTLRRAWHWIKKEMTEGSF